MNGNSEPEELDFFISDYHMVNGFSTDVEDLMRLTGMLTEDDTYHYSTIGYTVDEDGDVGYEINAFVTVG